ncbi:translocation/assembly module TamB domain-containing protein [Geobacter grbiciae]|uniref:translocation/assembly module TamB domain-containing protein n=1 Tax=Geobacter grbiciae TaxID=155042 RepID=UPI001C028E5F|nr:translocation/assembly module TamB domain-containing protein [Geobacter grbiciae]
MKRIAAYLLVVLILGVLLAGGFAARWLLGTPEGARWLLAAISHLTPLTITARQVEGRAGRDLRLGGVRAAWPTGYLEAERLRFRWHPLLLLTGTVAVRELSLDRVLIQDNAPPSTAAPDLAWPTVTGVGARIDGFVDELGITGLRYRRRTGPIQDVGDLSARVTWHDRTLTVGRLSARAPAGAMTGQVVAAFERPALGADLTAVTADAIAGFRRFTLATRLTPARAPEQMAGTLSLMAADGAKRSATLAGKVGMTRTGFTLHALRLAEGGRRGTVTADGTVTLTAGDPVADLRATLESLDLAPETGTATAISGTVALAGTWRDYRGHVDLANAGKGWRTARLGAAVKGTDRGMVLSSLAGNLLGGTVSGALNLGWDKGFALSGSLRGRGLDPARITPGWDGAVNLDISGGARWAGTPLPSGTVNLTLRESRLRGHPLTGALDTRSDGSDLQVRELALHGKGFDLEAQGALRERIGFTADITDLGGLVPDTRGRLALEGWTRYRNDRLAGSITGTGSGLGTGTLTVASADVAASLADDATETLAARLRLTGVSAGTLRADTAAITAAGSLARHTVEGDIRSGAYSAAATFAGGYADGSWRGRITRLAARDPAGPVHLTAPADLAVTSAAITLGPLVLAGTGGERLELAADLGRKTLLGTVRGSWQELDLAHAAPWLPREFHLAGRLSGNATAHLLPDNRMDLAGRGSLAAGAFRWAGADGGINATGAHGEVSLSWRGGVGKGARLRTDDRLIFTGDATAQAAVTAGGQEIAVPKLALALQGGPEGMETRLDLESADGGTLQARFSSRGAARFAVPERGEFTASWKGLDLALARPWLPKGVDLSGRLAGEAGGSLLPGSRIDARGTAAVSQGTVRRHDGVREYAVHLRQADASWNWRDTALAGNLSLTLAEYGEAKGTFRLPLAARIPTSLDPRGPVQATLTGELRERGVLALLFPGLVQESHGTLRLDLGVDGTWQAPRLGGTFALADAGAYLPPAGIRLDGVALNGRLAGNEITIESLKTKSGAGSLTATAVIGLDRWRVASYRGTVTGDRFQTVNIPEVQMLATPKLTFEGTPAKVAVRGEITVPELLVTAAGTGGPVKSSPDVVLEGAPPHEETEFPLALDIRIGVTLGDRVIVKTEGIDAQLGGSVDLAILCPDRVTSTGAIRVIKGHYSTYGVKLEIVRGRVFYAGGPIDRPTLDFLALRTEGDVKAGVTVTGTADQPVVKLYSEPAMPDTEILSYIVLGRPLSGDQGDTGLLMKAAGALLSAGQSVSLQDQLRQRIGIDVLDVSGAKGTSYGGYRKIAVAPGGTAASTAGIGETMVTVGKYLTPDLYLSYGRSLFSERNQVVLRYRLMKQLEIETQAGTELGADITYRIDFD